MYTKPLPYLSRTATPPPIVLGESDYRQILIRELNTRCAVNARYSMRAFARDLRISPSLLSQVLLAKKGLSVKTAEIIAIQLGWNRTESAYFRALVQMHHSRTAISRDIARSTIDQMNAATPVRSLELDAFQIISDWYHFAILQALRIKELNGLPARIAKKLAIPKERVIQALARLEKLELVRKNKERWEVCEDTVFTPDGVPSEAIKQFHSQVLKKASEAIYQQPVDERHFVSTFIAIDKTALPKIKKRFREFNQSLMDQFGESKTPDEVYSFSFQLFRISEPHSLAEGY